MPLPFPPSPNTGSVVDIVVPNLTKSSAHVAMLLPWTVNRMFRIHLQYLVRYSPRLWTYFRQLWRVPWVTLSVCAHDSCPQTNSKEKNTITSIYLFPPVTRQPPFFLPTHHVILSLQLSHMISPFHPTCHHCTQPTKYLLQLFIKHLTLLHRPLLQQPQVQSQDQPTSSIDWTPFRHRGM